MRRRRKEGITIYDSSGAKLRSRHLNSRQRNWSMGCSRKQSEPKIGRKRKKKKKKRKRKKGRKRKGFVEVDNSSRRMVAAEKLFRHEQEHRDIPVEESHNL